MFYAVIGVTTRFPLQNVVIFSDGKVTGGFFPMGMRPVRLAYVDP